MGSSRTPSASLRIDRRTRARIAGDDGTVLVEAAFVFPVLFYFLFGVFEMGLLFRSYLTLGNAMRAGGRVAAIVGDDVDADFRILQAMSTESRAIAVNSLVRIVIFKATAAAATDAPLTVPSNCLNAALTTTSTGVPLLADNCNVYYPPWALNKARVPEEFDCVAATPAGAPVAADVASGWCPTKRHTALDNQGTPVNGPPDWVGIYVELRHTYVTGLFGRTKKMSDTLVIQVEPKSLH